MHHVVVPVDPVTDPSWMGLRNHVITDGVHKSDDVRATSRESMEKRSEGIKILKGFIIMFLALFSPLQFVGEYCVKAIKQHKMEQSIIFCRTKLDCDNLERYFCQLGGGPRVHQHELSCVCLHSDRRPPERRANLEQFKKKKVSYN